MKPLERKIRNLENNLLAKPEIGSTRFCPCGLPEAEQTLLERARQIAASKIPYEDKTSTQKVVLERALQLLQFRIFDLFTTFMEGLLCQEDKTARVTLHERFIWFIHELRKEITILKNKWIK